MLEKLKTLEKLHSSKLVAVIRGDSDINAIKTADACIKGKITSIELTFTTPHADQVIEKLCNSFKHYPDVIIGAGTVLDSESARLAIIAGARFIVSPSFNINVAKLCNLYSVPYIPGCFSPSEIQSALESGVDIVKIFPSAVMGQNIIAELKGPFPKLNIMPSGGINLNNLKEWIKAGAFAVGIGGSLVKPAENNDFDGVTQNAIKFNSELINIMKKI